MDHHALGVAVCLIGLIGLAGCSGATTPAIGGDAGAQDSASDSGVVLAEAAADAANAYCARAQACAPAYITIAYGDLATCVRTFTDDVMRGFAGPGVNATPEWVEGCAAAVPQATCGDLLGHKMIAACKSVPGSLADGAACADDGQCKSTRCRVGANQTCGVCGPHSAAGASCGVTDDCADGLACLSGTCVAYGEASATCDATHPCRPDLACTSGVCGRANPVGTTSCSAAKECDLPNGVVCNPTTTTCETLTFAGQGAACGLVGGRLVQCIGPSACVGVSAPKYQGTCSTVAAIGAACDTFAGPTCGPGAVCDCGVGADGGCAGRCKTKDPAACK